MQIAVLINRRLLEFHLTVAPETQKQTTDPSGILGEHFKCVSQTSSPHTHTPLPRILPRVPQKYENVHFRLIVDQYIQETTGFIRVSDKNNFPYMISVPPPPIRSA